jgi:hypothetical protein
MKASEARLITYRNLHGPVIAPLLKHVHDKIADAAAKGRYEINHPLHGYTTGGLSCWPTHVEQEALWAALQQEDYIVKHHPDPDPGHPASGPYTTVSW